MSEAQNINSPEKSTSPMTSPGLQNRFLIPSPVPTRRTRTKSMSERAAEGPTHQGVITAFCREKGHGFIHDDNGAKGDIFVHISDIEGDWVPKQGDVVNFKTILIPPKNEKHQAVHVRITHLNDQVKHERWNSAEPVNVQNLDQ